MELERARKKKLLRQAERAAAATEKAAEKRMLDKPALKRQVRRDVKAQELQEAAADVAATAARADD